MHETGAVEATGHKCLALPGRDGKITAAQVQAAWDAHRANPTHEHEVQPGIVYISNPTEWGTLYTKAELTELSRVCRACGMYLFMDGARMAYGLMSEANDLTLADIAALCDAFYLGGTKCGALFGEALVLTAPALDKDFRYALKQHGGMLAKGRLLGLQFLRFCRARTGGSPTLPWPPRRTPRPRGSPTRLRPKLPHAHALPHQPAVPGFAQSLGRQAGGKVCLFADGHDGGRAGHRAVLHELGHPGRGCGRLLADIAAL